MNNLLGWLGNISFVYGAYAFSVKSIKGFYAQILGNLLYVFQAYYTNNFPLFSLSIVLILINSYGIYKWNKQLSINQIKIHAESSWVKQLMDCYKEQFLNKK